MNTLENKSHTNNNSTLTNEGLKKIHQRSLGYWFEDGLLEIVLGGLFLLLGVTFSIEGISDPGTLARRLSGIFALLIMVFGSIAARPIIRRLKERITYPRLGYFRERSEDAATTGRGVLTFIGIAFGLGLKERVETAVSFTEAQGTLLSILDRTRTAVAERLLLAQLPQGRLRGGLLEVLVRAQGRDHRPQGQDATAQHDQRGRAVAGIPHCRGNPSASPAS